MLKPWVVAVTAHASTAPAAIRIRLTPIPIETSLSSIDGDLPPRSARTTPNTAGEERDQPDDREDRGNDEEPVQREPDAEGDDGKQGDQNQQKHVATPPVARSLGMKRARAVHGYARLRLVGKNSTGLRV